MSEQHLPDFGDEDIYKDLRLRAVEAAARLRAVPEHLDGQEEYDLMSTAPGVSLLLREVTKNLRKAAGDAVHRAAGYADEDAWLVNLPVGAYRVKETSVMLTPRASFDEDGQLVNAEAWLSVPTESVIEIQGSNGTVWKNEL